MRSITSSLFQQVKQETVSSQAMRLMKQLSLSQRIRDVGELEKIRRYGHLRWLIAKHFLSKPLDEVIARNGNTGTFSLRALARTRMFSTVLERVMPQDEEGNIGLKV